MELQVEISRKGSILMFFAIYLFIYLALRHTYISKQRLISKVHTQNCCLSRGFYISMIFRPSFLPHQSIRQGSGQVRLLIQPLVNWWFSSNPEITRAWKIGVRQVFYTVMYIYQCLYWISNKTIFYHPWQWHSTIKWNSYHFFPLVHHNQKLFPFGIPLG